MSSPSTSPRKPADTTPAPHRPRCSSRLAGCIAHYARRYRHRHQIDPAGLAVDASFAIGGRPARVESIEVTLTPPAAMPPQRRDAFVVVASGCTVHNTLHHEPTVTLTLA